MKKTGAKCIRRGKASSYKYSGKKSHNKFLLEVFLFLNEKYASNIGQIIDLEILKKA